MVIGPRTDRCVNIRECIRADGRLLHYWWSPEGLRTPSRILSFRDKMRSEVLWNPFPSNSPLRWWKIFREYSQDRSLRQDDALWQHRTHEHMSKDSYVSLRYNNKYKENIFWQFVDVWAEKLLSFFKVKFRLEKGPFCEGLFWAQGTLSLGFFLLESQKKVFCCQTFFVSDFFSFFFTKKMFSEPENWEEQIRQIRQSHQI